MPLKVQSGKTGKTYEMPWSLATDPSDDEVDKFIATQEAGNNQPTTPTQPVQPVKTQPGTYLHGSGGKTRDIFESVLPESNRNYTPETLPSFPARAAKEILYEDMVRPALSAGGMAMSGLADTGAMAYGPAIKAGVKGLVKKIPFLDKIFNSEIGQLPGVAAPPKVAPVKAIEPSLEDTLHAPVRTNPQFTPVGEEPSVFGAEFKTPDPVASVMQNTAKGSASMLGKGDRQKFTLPPTLRGAKPRYNFGNKIYIPQFENDLDKAAYIIAQKVPSKNDAGYLKFFIDATGMDEKGARAYGQQVRARIKANSIGAEPGDIVIPDMFSKFKKPNSVPSAVPGEVLDQSQVANAAFVKEGSAPVVPKPKLRQGVDQNGVQQVSLVNPSRETIDQLGAKGYRPTGEINPDNSIVMVREVVPESGVVPVKPVGRQPEILPKETSVVTPGMDDKQKFFVEDTQRMRDNAYRASQDPEKVAAQAKIKSDWDATQKGLRVNDFLEKALKDPNDTGFAKGYGDMSPGQQAQYDSLEAKIRQFGLDVENPVKSNNFKARLVDKDGNEVDLFDLDSGKYSPSGVQSVKAIEPNNIPIVNRPYEAADYAMDNAYTRARGGEVTPELEALANSKKGGPPSAPPPFTPPSFPGGGNGGVPPINPGTAKVANIPQPKKPGLITLLGTNLKSATAGLDLSAPLRQGRALMHKKEFYKALPDMFKSMASEKGYDDVIGAITSHPNFEAATKHGLSITKLTDDLTTREEQFMGNLVEKIPGVGRLYRGSGRAYTGFLDKLRFDTYNSLMDDALKLGKKADDIGPEIADLVNVMTGRGKLGGFEGAAPLLNATFFSPRFLSSRVKLLTSPVSYAKADPFVRKEALKSLAALVGSQATLVGLYAAAKGDIKDFDPLKSKSWKQALGDPTSADFMKAKFGDSRMDTNAGLQQLAVLATRLAMGKTTSSVTGKTSQLDTGKFGGATSGGTIGRFLTSKEAPLLSLVADLWTGKDFKGEKQGATESILRHTTPMLLQDAYDLAQTDSKYSWLLLAPAALGASVQTYKDKKKKNPLLK